MLKLDGSHEGLVRPTVSIVIPNYNHGHLIEEALTAALGQTRPALEILVLDDGSTDDSAERIERVAAAAPSVRFFRHDRNLGVVPRMTEGLAAARGDFVLFSGADDRLDTNIIARAMAAAASAPDLGVVFSDPAELDGETGAIRVFPLYLSDVPLMLPPRRMAELARRYTLYPNVGNVFFNRRHLSAVGFEEALRWHADYFAFYLMAFRHGACYVPGALSYFRISPNSYSSTARPAEERRRIFSAWLSRLKAADMVDVWPIFRRAAVLPSYFPGAITLAAAHGFLSSVLLRRILTQSLWNALRGWVPLSVRRRARRIRGNLGRSWLSRTSSVGGA